jgi:exodeoxyribonuclease-3
MSTEHELYKPERWIDDALFAPEARAAFFRLLGQDWTDAFGTIHPDGTIYTFWDYFRNAYARDARLRIAHLLLTPSIAPRLTNAQVDVMCADGTRPAITHQRGSRLPGRRRDRDSSLMQRC